MIPLRYASRTPVRFPVVTVTRIVLNVLAFVGKSAVTRRRSSDGRSFRPNP